MNSYNTIFQLLSEAKIFKDFRTQKRRYYVAPVRYDAWIPGRAKDSIKASEQGLVAFMDAPASSKDHYELSRKFDKEFPTTYYEPESPGKNKPWENYRLEQSLGMIVDHNLGTVNVDLEEFQKYHHRRPAPGNNRYSYTIPGPNSNFSNSPKVKKILALVVQQDHEVLKFKLAGTDTFKDMTVEQFLRVPDQAQQVIQKTSGTLTMYHGTSMARAREILKRGLRPGNSQGHSDLVSGYSEFNIYLSPNKETARNYASRAATVDRSSGVVLQVIVRDFTKIIPDEDTMNWIRNSRAGKYYDKVAKDIPDLHNKDSGEPYADTHFRHWNWKEVSPAMTKLLRLWMADPNAYRGSVAYRGSIPPRDIKIVQTYKITKMPRDPDDAEFDSAMKATHATLKDYDQDNPFHPAKQTK
jgi:hypothetical protein